MVRDRLGRRLVSRRDVHRCARCVIWAATLAAAVLVTMVPGAGELVRGAFALERTPASAAEFAAIASNNVRLALIPVAVAALGLGRSAAGRVVGDALVAAPLLVNGALVGAVLGGYGVALLRRSSTCRSSGRRSRSGRRRGG